MPKLEDFSSATLTPTLSERPDLQGQPARASIMQELKYELCCHSDRSRFEVLRDVEMTKVSDNFRVQIANAMDTCDVAILVISVESSAGRRSARRNSPRLIEARKAAVPGGD